MQKAVSIPITENRYALYIFFFGGGHYYVHGVLVFKSLNNHAKAVIEPHGALLCPWGLIT